MEDLLAKLNKIDLYKCERIKVGDVLYYPFIRYKRDKNVITYCINCLKRTFVACNSLDFKGDGTTLFLFSHSYNNRKDYERSFNALIGLVNNSVRMVGCDIRLVHIFYLKYILLPYRWNKKFKDIIKDKQLRWHLIFELYCAFLDYEEFNRYRKKYKLSVSKLITFCDTHAVDSFFTQMFNANERITVTLQHGIYNSDTWIYRGSHSKYFLAYGQQSVDVGVSVGKIGDLMPKVGVLSSIGVKHVTNCNRRDIKCIGVFLDGDVINDNINMITFMQNFCQKYAKKMYIKFHPSNEPKDYKDVIDSQVVIQCIHNEMLATEIISKIDLCIVRNSTVFVEALMLSVPALIYTDDFQEYHQYGETITCKFSDEQELLHMLDEINNNFTEYYKEICEYLGIYSDTAYKYKTALNDIGIN